ncbi:MAG: GxxExxY protein [Tissierellia bacterium]|nr:GxxExxY protein [Tissierellia bacterium]
MDKESIYKRVLDCAFEVHKTLGPGLLENTYKHCLAHELKIAGLNIEIEKEIPVIYKDVRLDCGYRIDILVENQIIIELKAVEKLTDIHLAQLLSYMKLSKINLGLLINFNTKYLIQGIKRVIL